MDMKVWLVFNALGWCSWTESSYKGIGAICRSKKLMQYSDARASGLNAELFHNAAITLNTV